MERDSGCTAFLAGYINCCNARTRANFGGLMKRDWQGKKVVVIGAARQGLAASRYLAKRSAQVVLTDNRPLSDFSDLEGQLSGFAIKLHLGGHPTGILDGADVVCVSGGVPLTIPLIKEAVSRG